MHFSHWHTLFVQRSGRVRPTIDDTQEIPPSWREPLAASLARFQLGETGEGRIVADLRRKARAWKLDEGYLRSLALFIAEEGRHAAILGDAVRALGGRPLRKSWASEGFSHVRRVAGPGTELMVLLAAEVAALCFYETMAARLPQGELRQAIRQVASDETVHLRFHVDFLCQALPSTAARWAVASAWHPLALAAATVIITDHSATLRTIGVRRRQVWTRARSITIDTAEAIMAGPHESRGAQQAFKTWVPEIIQPLRSLRWRGGYARVASGGDTQLRTARSRAACTVGEPDRRRPGQTWDRKVPCRGSHRAD